MRKQVAALRARVPWRAGAVALVVVAALAVGGERALAWQDEHARATDEKDAAAAAAAEVEGLIDISGSTSEDDVAKLLDGATAGFRSELEAQADRLRRTLSKNKVAATGKVVSTGVVKLEGGRATVIVAAVGTVKNKQTAEAEPRNYRLRVDLQRDDDRWLVSGLEFVA
ncbi:MULTISPECIES: nuclear transport factor 2 family protein [Nocardioides]|uniref:Nuclear transport factor 2 family protein n=1 Tax=Nocardioides vastitatis TaxID=2568655 RepID=A0ABW0ZKE5_9ACTN|nr:nuclear transport factor 2 family protein [Nocardioides sp.]THJ16030.1 hypothetical protein E7Z54_00260 [Nocardioides sp.]